MANTKSAVKRARQNIKRRLRNASNRSMYRTYIKHVLKAVEAGDKEAASLAIVKAQSVLDKVAGKGLIHKNKAARLKSRLTAKVKALVVS